jgi:hypothetical protein
MNNIKIHKITTSRFMVINIVIPISISETIKDKEKPQVMCILYEVVA